MPTLGTTSTYRYRLDLTDPQVPAPWTVALILEEIGGTEVARWWNITWWQYLLQNQMRRYEIDYMMINPVLPGMGTEGDGCGFNLPVCRFVCPASYCNEFLKETAFTLADTSGQWAYTIDPVFEAVVEDSHVEDGLGFDAAAQPGCEWQGQYTSQGVIDGLYVVVDMRLQVTDDPMDAALKVLTMTLTMTLSGLLTGTHNVTYQVDGIDPHALGPHTLAATTSQLFDLGVDGTITFPATVQLTPEV